MIPDGTELTLKNTQTPNLAEMPLKLKTISLIRSHMLSKLQLALWVLIVSLATCQANAFDDFKYLPSGKYDHGIQTPEQFLGFKIGERHIRHHQLVDYCEYLGEKSNLAVAEKYATSHGHRPLMTLTITSEKNHKRLDEILAAHRDLCDPQKSKAIDIADLPTVIYMGYCVHGDESSGANAVPLVGYYLLAGPGKKLLDNLVVVIDPCLNPDGFDRFAAWANANKGKNINADPQTREHNQPWPGGRVNYYWFDLNRDWMPLQHPESRGRAKVFYKYRPNIVLDYHEMGTNSTYFFQPGVPTRSHPLTPKKNLELTRKIATYHAKALDKIGSLYYTEERFDDFYMGKGSTYPDLHGTIGILFEQASSRGHVQENDNGLLTFPFTIRNQFTTSLTSLQAATEMRKELLEFQREFYLQSLRMATEDKTLCHVLTSPNNPGRIAQFAKMLVQHNIKVTFADGKLYVPTRQAEYRFIDSLFDKRTNFEENIFYDVSSWNMASAFGLNHSRETESNGEILNAIKRATVDLPQSVSTTKVDIRPEVIGYTIDWRNDSAQQLLVKLCDAEVKVKVAGKPFGTAVGEFPIGTLMIPLGIQKDKTQKIQMLLQGALTKTPISENFITPIRSGLTRKGIDLGSSTFADVTIPKTLVVVGNGSDRYQAGAIWHFLDHRLGMTVSLIEADRIGSADLSRYTTIVMPKGEYKNISESATKTIESWVGNGGTLVCFNKSIEWAMKAGMVANAAPKKGDHVDHEQEHAGEESGKANEANKKPIQKPYIDASSESALKLVSGAIFRTHIDQTHPIGYGFPSKELHVFRNSTQILEPSKNPYANPIVYTDSPQVSGYASAENVKKIANTASCRIAKKGKGRIVMFVDDVTFRAFWYGSERLLSNAIFFGSSIRVPNVKDEEGGHGHVHQD